MRQEMVQQHPWHRSYPTEVPHSIAYPPDSLPQLLERTAADHGETVATIFFGAKLTYQELLQDVQQMAGGLAALGVRKGDRVALMLPNCPQAVIGYYAVLYLGAVVVQVNPLYMDRELKHQLSDCGARVIIALDMVAPKVLEVWGETQLSHLVVTSVADYLPKAMALIFPLKQKLDGHAVHLPKQPSIHKWSQLMDQPARKAPVLVDVENDIAILQYTGATTGLAKGCVLTHRNLTANVLQMSAWSYKLGDPGTKIMAALPFFHVYGMTTIMNYAISTAGTMVLVPKFDLKQILRMIQRYQPRFFPGAPTMYVALANAAESQGGCDLSSIDVCISGAAPLPVEVQNQFERLTHGKLVEGYGLTEAAPITHCNPVWGDRRKGSIGLPFPDTVAAILHPETGEEMPLGAEGELCIQGPQVMKGYWNNPEATEQALRGGWLHTGDIARMDEDGYFYIVDRMKDMIIAGGFNIYPREVEEVLYEIPAIKEAAIIGVPDEYRGETVKAFLVVKSGQTLTEEEVSAYCRKHLASYKVPRLYEFRAELPKTLIGKVLRRKLREEEEARRAASSRIAAAVDKDGGSA